MRDGRMRRLRQSVVYTRRKFCSKKIYRGTQSSQNDEQMEPNTNSCYLKRHQLDQLQSKLTCATPSSYLAAYTAYRRRDNHAEVFATTLTLIRVELSFLRRSKRCLSIGTGTGKHELQFVNSLMPLLTSFIGVEPDAESAALLRANLAQNLPVVEVHVVEQRVETWKGPENHADVILVFHFMYYCNDPELRQQFFHQLFAWTKTGGVVVILMDIHDASPSGIHQLCEASNADRTIPTYDRTRSDLIRVGFHLYHEFGFVYSRDWSNPDDNLLRFIQLVRNVQHSVPKSAESSLDEIRSNMRLLKIDQKTEGNTVLGVFLKGTPASEDSLI